MASLIFPLRSACNATRPGNGWDGLRWRDALQKSRENCRQEMHHWLQVLLRKNTSPLRERLVVFWMTQNKNCTFPLHRHLLSALELYDPKLLHRPTKHLYKSKMIRKSLKYQKAKRHWLSQLLSTFAFLHKRFISPRFSGFSISIPVTGPWQILATETPYSILSARPGQLNLTFIVQR